MSEYPIVPARPQDLRRVGIIELAAARLLRGYAPERVLNETTSDDEVLRALRQGLLWVVLADDTAVGFVRLDVLDRGTVHLEEVDVLPAYGRRGLGTRLVNHACRWAETQGYEDVTLTTFRDVPWNMPFYERLGFRAVAESHLTAALRGIVADETRRGLDPRRRVVMRRRCRPQAEQGET